MLSYNQTALNDDFKYHGRIYSFYIIVGENIIAIAILDFSLLLLVRLSFLIIFASFLVSVLCFFFDGFLSKLLLFRNIGLFSIAPHLVFALSTLR